METLSKRYTKMQLITLYVDVIKQKCGLEQQVLKNALSLTFIAPRRNGLQRNEEARLYVAEIIYLARRPERVEGDKDISESQMICEVEREAAENSSRTRTYIELNRILDDCLSLDVRGVEERQTQIHARDEYDESMEPHFHHQHATL
ncbi:hypothetical protein V1477_016721 [Vespula maculifrons]|uniref:Uncharacterized protein n=1 Tax=Vespula maculifrons TaxID=7453 RepID=A0ABD2B3Z4_VESMC